MRVSDLDYRLPAELIAQEPPSDRSASRLLLVCRRTGRIQDRLFRELPDLLSSSDSLVMNNSRVFPARLLGERESGGRVELLLLRPAPPSSVSTAQQAGTDLSGASSAETVSSGTATWEVLARPKRKLRLDSCLYFSPDLRGKVVDLGPKEKAQVEFQFQGDFHAVLEKAGHVPLPPYIHRSDVPQDRERYQTIYARPLGSVAAPTAGLHFTAAILDQLRARGVQCHFLTQHVGYGTFQPVKSETIEGHRIDPEPFEISPSEASAIRRAAGSGRRLIAVGTTTTRVLEYWKRHSVELQPLAGDTDLFIYPPFEFQIVQGLLTNFHLPRTSLFALVCAFLGTELAHACYRHAVQRRYRFYSYGDCMLAL